MNMKKTAFVILAGSLLFAGFNQDVYAAKTRKDYFFKPQLGGWFGPVTPLGETDELFDTELSGGIFFRINLPKDNFILKYFKIGVDISYQHYESKGINDLHFVPLYGSILGLLPIDIPVRIQLKWGAGAAYLYQRPDRLELWEPVIHTGLEVSFPAGRTVNIGLRLDYLYIYEGYLDSNAEGGHFLNIGICLYFNI